MDKNATLYELTRDEILPRVSASVPELPPRTPNAGSLGAKPWSSTPCAAVPSASRRLADGTSCRLKNFSPGSARSSRTASQGCASPGCRSIAMHHLPVRSSRGIEAGPSAGPGKGKDRRRGTNQAATDPTSWATVRMVGQTAGRARISSPILRGRNWPSVSAARNRPPSTTTLPRRIVVLGQAATSWPSHGV